MAHGERAEQHGHHREYWSRRPGRMLNWGRIGKWITHRFERAQRRREEHKVLRDAQQGMTDDGAPS